MILLRKLIIYCLLLSLYQSILKGQNYSYTIKRASFSTDKYSEFSPVYYRDGIVFCTDRGGGLFSLSGTGGKDFFDIYYVDTMVSSRKMEPELLSKNLQSRFNDGPVTFNSDFDTIYYTRNLMVEGKLKELSSPRNKLGIFYASYKEGEWKDIREFRFNNQWYNLVSPFLSPDGEKLYFASDMPEGYGGTDLYYCEWMGNYWDNPVNLGPNINTEKNETYPYINPLGDLLFSSDGHEGMGGKDIFLSRYKEDRWLEPIALNPPLNSEFDDFGIITDTYMENGYFSRDENGVIDIYEFHTPFAQFFYTEMQKENNYCFEFSDSGEIVIDTTSLYYRWNFGDGTFSIRQKTRHCYEGSGEYEVELDIYDRYTEQLFFHKKKFLLSLKEIEQAYISSPDLILKNEEFHVNAVKSRLTDFEIVNYTWQLGDTIRRAGPEIVHSYADTGVYEIKLLLNLKSTLTGKPSRQAISRRVKVVDNELKKLYFEEKLSKESKNYLKPAQSPNVELTNAYTAESFLNEAIFCIQLLETSERKSLDHSFFRKLPDKFKLEERFNVESQSYSYTIEQQIELMSLYPSFRELKNLGYNSALARLFIPQNPAERELISVLKKHSTSTDVIFDNYGRLNPRAYLLFDQLARILNTYKDVKLEISGHTDNLGSSSSNLSRSLTYAQTIADYIIGKGISKDRIRAEAYGENKPIASNRYEINRMKNRRIEFRIF